MANADAAAATMITKSIGVYPMAGLADDESREWPETSTFTLESVLLLSVVVVAVMSVSVIVVPCDGLAAPTVGGDRLTVRLPITTSSIPEMLLIASTRPAPRTPLSMAYVKFVKAEEAGPAELLGGSSIEIE